MNIRDLILASLAPLTLSGCFGCGGGDTDFEDETGAVTAGDIDYLLEWSEAETVAELSCEDICSSAVFGGQLVQVSTTACNHDVDPAMSLDSMDSGTDPESVVGSVTCSGTSTTICEGRRPLGYREQRCGYYARAAHLEAASIVAFVQLSRQLTAWGAPLELIARCRAAACDELRHARTIARLAHRAGQPIPALGLDPFADDRLSVAIHNATEGCVYETWAAVEALLKSRLAHTPELRAIYAGIARDELAHAQLAWDLHPWLISTLSPAQIQRVEAARRQAIHTLRGHALIQLAELPAELGLAGFAQAEQLLAGFLERLAA